MIKLCMILGYLLINFIIDYISKIRSQNGKMEYHPVNKVLIKLVSMYYVFIIYYYSMLFICIFAI